ncbi:hypothetical protein H0S68_25580 (plasmid) [Serratia sp. AXJ-M]|uniref:hypothetical protein n=1 Tax=Serratia sp. AXJ-M TaxID=2754727 RepID=UPI00397E8E06
MSIDNSLARLRQRRRGNEKVLTFDSADRDVFLAKNRQQEQWEKRETSKPFTRYALGAMQEVDPDYTRISVVTAERIQNQLYGRLLEESRVTEFRLQGSVPLNVHIKGVSDVDILTLDLGFLTYDTTGVRARRGEYRYPTTDTAVSRLQSLRHQCITALRKAFPAVEIDSSGRKSLRLRGGSLAREVDVVPSHWFDTADYQQTGAEYHRGVAILDTSIPITLDNYPFLHIERIRNRCETTLGSLRKAIRLCKNLKADAIEEGRNCNLSSFDIASLIYHADTAQLLHGAVYELAILAETQRFLAFLVANPAYARTLEVPDGSRRILDEEAKFDGLAQLSREVAALMVQVAREQQTLLTNHHLLNIDESRRLLNQRYIA